MSRDSGMDGNGEGHNLSSVVFWLSLRKKEWLNRKDDTGKENRRSCFVDWDIA